MQILKVEIQLPPPLMFSSSIVGITVAKKNGPFPFSQIQKQQQQQQQQTELEFRHLDCNRNGSIVSGRQNCTVTAKEPM